MTRVHAWMRRDWGGTPALTPALSRSGRGRVLGRVVVVREFDK
nr:hypothetical protein [uncultured Methanoregula sp.]